MGALGLAVLDAVVSRPAAAGRVGGALSGVGTIVRKFISPAVPAFAPSTPPTAAPPPTAPASVAPLPFPAYPSPAVAPAAFVPSTYPAAAAPAAGAYYL